MNLIICKSYHQMNTQKVANRMAKVLDCDVIDPGKVDQKMIDRSDIIGLGSGIYDYKHHVLLLKLVDKLNFSGKPVFIFSTAGVVMKKFDNELLNRLNGAKVLGSFMCRGFNKNNERKGNTWIENRALDILQLVGGMNKGHPTEKELLSAENFAKEMKKKSTNS